MKTKFEKSLLLAVVALLAAISATPATAQESARDERLAQLEAIVQRHDSQLGTLNTKVTSNDGKLTKLLEITEAIASRQVNASRESQIAAAKQPQLTPVSTRSPQTQLPRSAYDSPRSSRRQYRHSGPGVVIVISGYGYRYEDPYHGDDESDPIDSDYYSSGFKTVACK